MKEILKVENLSVSFGGLKAVNDLDFMLNKGELLGLIGPNGAGKTTALKLIIGMIKPSSGKIILAGKDISNLPVHKRVRAGLGLSHQLVQPFKNMTLTENVTLALGKEKTKIPLMSIFYKRKSQEVEKALEFLEIVGIKDSADEMPSKMPLGYLKRLEVARALSLNPKVLLLDEPLAGLNQAEASKIADTILKLNKSGLSIILIEHNLSEVIRICSRLIVLESGQKIADGIPEEVMKNEDVISAYIGDEDDITVE